LLRLEELVRGFLISKETLSVRMLDDSRDPTPLLKEIRDDKVSTIIIDANASISHLILRKASELGMTSAFYKYILTTMDFPILHLDGVVEDSSNILGFSMFNTSHPFYPEFVRSLNMSWRENCEASTYPGPAETLSVRMLDDSRDPTPLLKEIRDDKVSTIIIDANASISHLILRKVGPSLPHL
ncbi:hypothetical protein Celaphus_00004545, partial [Cervus elaphus hippelaphus]